MSDRVQETFDRVKALGLPTGQSDAEIYNFCHNAVYYHKETVSELTDDELKNEWGAYVEFLEEEALEEFKAEQRINRSAGTGII